MKSMLEAMGVVVAFGLGGLAFWVTWSQASPSGGQSVDAQPAGEGGTERGRYLTHDVAMCVECHSPRDEEGNLIREKLFRGGRIPVDGPQWVDEWALVPPDLVALADDGPHRVLSVLITGKRPDGTSPSRPMPPFRLSPEDAQAIVTYLRSLER